jgi:dipeptidyl aminopeptidase/acylaminoacyl peptidase
MSTPLQPKINHTLLKRTAFFLIGLAVVFGGIRYVQSLQGDYDLGGDSTGMIAAIRMESDGQQAVLIDSEGHVKTTSSWKPGNVDREPAWSPDGKYLFFCSDREKTIFNVFRWNPQKGDAESRTFGSPSRGNPTFAPQGGPDSLLLVAGGAVRELDPKTKKTPQILPPQNAEIAQSSNDEGGAGGAEASFTAIYGGLGKSFRIARYFGDKRYIAAIMKRDEGEVLVIQDLQLVNDKVPKPEPIVAGDRIEFDIDPKTNRVAFSVQNFRWVDPKVVPPRFRKNNKIIVPFRNFVGMVSPGDQPTPITASPDDNVGFTAPRVSPDGSRLLLIAGPMKDGALEPKSLITMPFTANGIQAKAILSEGEVYEPSWSSDSKQILFAKRTNGKRDIYKIGADGANLSNLTKGSGDFYTPLFSPLTK